MLSEEVWVQVVFQMFSEVEVRVLSRSEQSSSVITFLANHVFFFPFHRSIVTLLDLLVPVEIVMLLCS